MTINNCEKCPFCTKKGSVTQQCWAIYYFDTLVQLDFQSACSYIDKVLGISNLIEERVVPMKIALQHIEDKRLLKIFCKKIRKIYAVY